MSRFVVTLAVLAGLFLKASYADSSSSASSAAAAQSNDNGSTLSSAAACSAAQSRSSGRKPDSSSAAASSAAQSNVCGKTSSSASSVAAAQSNGGNTSSSAIASASTQSNNGKRICIGPNEVYVKCPGCSPQTCLTRNKQYFCPLIRVCKPSCRCKQGYYRNSKRVCVPSSQCDSCGGDVNAIPGCGTNCGKKCTDLIDPQTICILICLPDGCNCKVGFYYDKNTKKCVKPEECSDICTEPNEVYDGCPDDSPQTCESRYETYPYPLISASKTESDCKPACRCEKGYLRNSQGICIPSSECGNPTCPSNEMYSSCPPIQCDADYCPNNRNSPQACASPKICGKGRCICDFNTKRDRLTGRCIPIKNCPPFPCDRPNEIYDSCPPVCPGQTCTDFINNTTCPRFRIGIVVPCKPACRCIDGFYRDKAGYCISGQMCKESCRGDSNAVPGCGNNCGRRCSDLVTPRPICILSCDLDGCDCKDGFYYDSNKNYCVSPDKCTSICTEPNEVYDKCPDCSPQTCATRDKIYNCPLIPANKIGPNCKPACRCIKNYFRNSQEICVPSNECPSPICQIGEFYDNCPQFECEGEYCPANRDSPQTCPTPIICGRGRCVCNFNSKRDRSTGLCIPIRNCPPFACDKPNEVYDSCPPECPGQKCTDFLNNATCPKYPTDNTVPCSPECRCKEGYYRDSNNNCVCAQNCKAERAAQTCDDVEGDRLALIQGSNNFTTKFLYELVNMNPETSVIASPASVLTPLAELALYAQGPTFTQIIAILNLQTKEQIRCAFKAFLDTFQATQDTELDLANKIYVNDEYKLSESFQNDAMTIFDAEAEAIDFENPSQAAGEINEWVSEQTKGKITNLVSSDMFDSLTRLVLVNAVYFKGTWKTKFDPNKTESTDFYVNPSKTIQIQMMQLKTEMKYANNNDLDAQIIELPYLDENITLLVIVPNQKFGLLDVIIQLQNLTILNIVLNDFTLQTVTLFLPKINVSTTIDLEKNLKQDGVETVFTPCAELSGITVPDESLYVSTAIQKATIDINEEGSVAAATNAVIVGFAAIAAVENYVVRADHPYIYCITVHNILLFCGVFYG